MVTADSVEILSQASHRGRYLDRDLKVEHNDIKIVGEGTPSTRNSMYREIEESKSRVFTGKV